MAEGVRVVFNFFCYFYAISLDSSIEFVRDTKEEQISRSLCTLKNKFVMINFRLSHHSPLLVVDACQVPVDDSVVGTEVQGAQVGGHGPATRKMVVVVGWYE